MRARGRSADDGRRSLMARASAHAGDGAGALFARLDATVRRAEEGEAVLLRLAGRIHMGEWDTRIADIVARAATLERSTE